jgi:hypothetical protein
LLPPPLQTADLLAQLAAGHHPTPARVRDLLSSAQEMGFALHGITELKELMATGEAWETAAQGLLAMPAAQEQVSALQLLIEQGQTVQLQFPELKDLAARISALNWEGQVQQLCSAVIQLHKVQQATTQQALAQGLAQLEEEEAKAAAEAPKAPEQAAEKPAQEGKDAEMAEAAVPAAPAAEVKPAEAAAEPAAEEAQPMDVDAAAPIAAAEAAAEQQAGTSAADAAEGDAEDAAAEGDAEEGDEEAAAAAAEPEAPPMTEEEKAAAAKAAARAKVEEEAAAVGVATARAAGALIAAADKAPLAQVLALVKQAHNLPVDQELYTVVSTAAQTAADWEKRVRPLLPSPDNQKPIPEADRVDFNDVNDLLLAGVGLPFQLESLAALQQVAAAHQQWEQLVQIVLAQRGSAVDNPTAAANRPQLSLVQTLRQHAQLSAIRSNLQPDLDAIQAAAEDWQERLRRGLAKRNSPFKLEKWLQILLNSAEAGVSALKYMHEPEEDPNALGRRRKRAAAAGQPQEAARLLCLCQQSMDNADMAAIQCECCQEWYHPRCMGMGQSQARNARSWLCPLCSCCEDNREPLESAELRIKRTRRPEAQVLLELLAEARALDVLVPEEAALEAAMQNFTVWHNTVQGLMAGHQRQRELEARTLVGARPAAAAQQQEQAPQLLAGGFMPTPAAANGDAAGAEANGSAEAAAAPATNGTAEPAAHAAKPAAAGEAATAAAAAEQPAAGAAERAAGESAQPADAAASAAAPASDAAGTSAAAEAGPTPMDTTPAAEAAAAPAAPAAAQPSSSAAPASTAAPAPAEPAPAQEVVVANPAEVLPERVIRAIIKQASAMEVDCFSLQDLGVRMLRVETWLARANPLINRTSKGSVELLGRLVK